MLRNIIFNSSIKLKICNLKYFSSKVPDKPTWNAVDPSKLPEPPEIDKETLILLERLSLVDFRTQEAVERLSDAIKFADQLLSVDVEGIEPMYTVLENLPCYLREDEVTEGNCREAILKNAMKTFEDYFVAPPGNIPLSTNLTGELRIEDQNQKSEDSNKI